MKLTDFITFSLVAGAKRQAKMRVVYKMGDDFEYDEFSDVEC
jgi:hypothetical protein